jgi:hypothetical protein
VSNDTQTGFTVTLLTGRQAGISYIPPSFSDEVVPIAQAHDTVKFKLSFANYLNPGLGIDPLLIVGQFKE